MDKRRGLWFNGSTFNLQDRPANAGRIVVSMIPDSTERLKIDLRRPRLRPVDVLPYEAEGKKGIFLRDPERIATGVLFLPAAGLVLLSMLDGEHDLRDIQAALMRRFGELVPLEAIENILRELDEHLFLTNERFFEARDRLQSEFEGAALRPALLAGQAYEAEPTALTGQLETYFDHPAGPGRSPAKTLSSPPRGMVAPHIDFVRGGPCYAWAYHLLEAAPPPSLVVILGTAHSPTQTLLSLCDKDFETPYGSLTLARDLARSLVERSASNLLSDALVHRQEHSVEFQTVWLKRTFGPDADLKILPLLCGSFYPLFEVGVRPAELEAYQQALACLRELLAAWERDRGTVLLLASADLSHVGPQFGDRFQVSGAVQRAVREYDLALLDLAVRGEADAFYDKIAQEGDPNHVCGLAAIYTLLQLLERPIGRLLAYDQWMEQSGQGLVAFASLVFP
jgi:hypothetical protein